MDAESIAAYNQLRAEASHANPITAVGVGLQMAHRVTALLILIVVALAAWRARNEWGWAERLVKLAFGWLGLIGCQIVLGAATLWTNKSADITTLHVAVGSVSLATGALLLLAMHRRTDHSGAADRRPAATNMGKVVRSGRAWA